MERREVDEPTACLPHQEASCLIKARHERGVLGKTIIYVSHRRPEVLGMADDLTVRRDGIVAAAGPRTTDRGRRQSTSRRLNSRWSSQVSATGPMWPSFSGFPTDLIVCTRPPSTSSTKA